MIHTEEVYHCNISRKWRRQMKTRRTDQLFKFVSRIDAYRHILPIENQHNVAIMFQEHLHILGMLYLATVARIIHLLGGRSIRIAK